MSDTTQPSTSHMVARALAQSQNASTEAADGCWICQQQLWISVFFDEPGHDAEQERGTERLSNIGKLYYAHADENERGIYPLYYNGLGVAFNPSSGARAQAAQDKAQSEAQGVLEEKEKEWLYKRGQWKDVLHPKNWGPDLLGLVAKAGLEAWDGLRDKPLVSQLTLSGVDTRMASALRDLKQIVDSQSVPVTALHVAVFGSGLGGAMARLFANRLQAQCSVQGNTLLLPSAKGQVPLHLRFVGLLDCVSSRVSNPVVGWAASKATLGMATLRVDGPMGLSRHIGRAVHLVAGHEQRATHRLDSIAKAQCPFEETVWPGTHQDVVGGLAHQTQQRSHELARVPLGELYYAAYGAGVPVLPMEKLKKTDIYLYNDFQFTHKNAQGAGAKSLTRQYGQSSGTLQEQLTWHMARYVAYLRLRLHTPEHPQRPAQRVYDLLAQQMGGFDRLVRHPRTTAAQRSLVFTAPVRALLRAYLQPLALSPAQVALLDAFVHDSLADSPVDRAAADMAGNGYFKVRGIDSSDELPDSLQAKAPGAVLVAD